MEKLLGIDNIDWDVVSFLRDKGISNLMTSDGSFFRDRARHAYDEFTLCLNTDNYARGVRAIDYSQDIYTIVKETIRCYPFISDSEVKFAGQEPLPGLYDAAVVRKIADYSESGQDGGSEIKIYAVLLLKTRMEYHPPPEFSEVKKQDDHEFEAF